MVGRDGRLSGSVGGEAALPEEIWCTFSDEGIDDSRQADEGIVRARRTGGDAR